MPEPPDGIVLVEIAERRDLLRAAYALACEALPQMPLHAPLEMPSYERWLEEEATGPDVLEGGTLLALDGERVVGFVSLLRRAADPRLAEHGLTAVAETHRNRGIATALKRAQIAWASSNGFRELMTSTQDGNAPMRAVNDKLGYEAAPRLDPLRRAARRDRGGARRRTGQTGMTCHECVRGGPNAPARARRRGAVRAEAVRAGARGRRRGSRSARRASR